MLGLTGPNESETSRGGGVGSTFVVPQPGINPKSRATTTIQGRNLFLMITFRVYFDNLHKKISEELKSILIIYQKIAHFSIKIQQIRIT